ncbi:MAG: hypothetical protein ACI9OJ_004160 [Myxococcota bacterium]
MSLGLPPAAVHHLGDLDVLDGDSSFGAGAYVLYFVADPATRMVLGVMALLGVMWSSSYLSIVDRMIRALNERRRLRRYPKLRSRVAQMVDEIKRMHWRVADLDRGFRKEDAVRAEIEAIQRHLTELVEGLSEVAGVEGNDPARPRSADRLRESVT